MTVRNSRSDLLQRRLDDLVQVGLPVAQEQVLEGRGGEIEGRLTVLRNWNIERLQHLWNVISLFTQKHRTLILLALADWHTATTGILCRQN